MPSRRTRSSVETTLTYAPVNPYEVTVTFDAGLGAVDWLLARDLLADGLIAPAGHGDVKVRPDGHAALSGDHASVLLELRSPIGCATLSACVERVAGFLNHTYDLVPSGTEHLRLDLDGELAEILRDNWSRVPGVVHDEPADRPPTAAHPPRRAAGAGFRRSLGDPLVGRPPARRETPMSAVGPHVDPLIPHHAPTGRECAARPHTRWRGWCGRVHALGPHAVGRRSGPACAHRRHAATTAGTSPL